MDQPLSRWAWLIAVVVTLGIAGPGPATTIEAIYTNIPGHPTAQVPGAAGEQFRSPLPPFLALYGSPEGFFWIFKAFTDNPDSNVNEVIVIGSSTAGTVVAKEGQPSPLAGLTYGFMDSDCGINRNGRYAFGNRLSGGPTATDEVLFTFDGTSIVVAVREGDAAPGLVDPNGAGDELFGNSLNSAHVLNDGTVAFKADLIQNIRTDFESALYRGSTVLAQEGTSPGTLAGDEVYDSFVSLSGNTFSSSADGLSWIVEADVLAGVGTEEAVVVNGNIVLRDGDVLPGLGSPVDEIFAVDMSGGGGWFARGTLLNGDVWAVRNGQVIAATGQPITRGSDELFADPILAVNGNFAGDYVVVAATSDGREVAVLNGQEVMARTGDEVDLGTAGPPLAFIGGFDANDAFLSDDLNDDLVDDRELYFFASLRDEAFQDLGDAFLVVRHAEACAWDCGDGDATVGVTDFLALLGQWGMAWTACDLGLGRPGVGIEEFLDLLAHWGPCPQRP